MKAILTIALICLATGQSIGQVVDADTVTVPAGTIASVPIMVTGYQGQLASEIVVRFDHNTITYQAVTNFHSQLAQSAKGVRTDSVAFGKIVVAVCDTVGMIHNVPDGEALFHIEFMAGGESPIIIDSVLFLATSNDSIIETHVNPDDGMIKIDNDLPVELKSFEVECDEGSVLTWVTATELNSDYFEVQRLDNNTTQFYRIGEVPAAGQSIIDQYYTFTDYATGTSENLYYRLKMVDQDQTYEYSDMITHVCEEFSWRATDISVSPNPQVIGGDVTLIIPAGLSGNIRLVNTLGQVVHYGSFEHIAPMESYVISGIDVAGVYTIFVEYTPFVDRKTSLFMKKIIFSSK